MSARTPEVTLIDYGMGNLRSVGRAFERAGARVRLAGDAEAVRDAERLVLPGVGHLGDCMQRLREGGIAESLVERIRAGCPYLGVCIGLQALLEEGDEGPARGLGLVPGRVARFPESLPGPIPHMGWNLASPVRAHPVVRESYFYFVHSYRAEKVPEAAVVARTEYGGWFPSAVGRDNWVAVQFHPEKSQRAGLALFERFLAWQP